jgi:transposase
MILSLLWVAYWQVHPDGYSYSQFCHLYGQWAKQLEPMMRQRHWASEMSATGLKTLFRQFDDQISNRT